MFHNTGLSSSINWGNQLLTTEADIVTAHGELPLLLLVLMSHLSIFTQVNIRNPTL